MDFWGLERNTEIFYTEKSGKKGTQMCSQAKKSVIIPIKNEADKIELCLEAVFSQSPKPHEVIVVVGHSTDKMVESAKKFPVDVVYEYYGTVRHIGQVLRVCVPIAGFTDAGCIPANTWLEYLDNDFGNDVGANGGMIR